MWIERERFVSILAQTQKVILTGAESHFRRAQDQKPYMKSMHMGVRIIVWGVGRNLFFEVHVGPKCVSSNLTKLQAHAVSALPVKENIQHMTSQYYLKTSHTLSKVW